MTLGTVIKKLSEGAESQGWGIQLFTSWQVQFIIYMACGLILLTFVVGGMSHIATANLHAFCNLLSVEIQTQL